MVGLNLKHTFMPVVAGLCLLALLAAAAAAPFSTSRPLTPLLSGLFPAAYAQTATEPVAGTPHQDKNSPPSPAKPATVSVESVPNVNLQDPNRYVSNPDGIISPADEAEINRMAAELERDLGVQVAVVALNSIGSNHYRQFATDLFQHWGVGQKGEDNGLLILLVLDPAQRSVTFETGYGLEGVLPDVIAYRIQQEYMIPALKNGDYSRGMREGMAAVSRHLRASGYESGAPVPAARTGSVVSESSSHTNSTSGMWPLLIFCAPFLLVFYFAWRKVRPRICPNCGKKTLKLTERQIVVPPSSSAEGTALDIWKCTNCGYVDKQKRRIPRYRHNSARGTGSGLAVLGGLALGGLAGRRSGGGFGSGRSGGGFGGGRSGGGGASSRF